MNEFFNILDEIWGEMLSHPYSRSEDGSPEGLGYLPEGNQKVWLDQYAAKCEGDVAIEGANLWNAAKFGSIHWNKGNTHPLRDG